MFEPLDDSSAPQPPVWLRDENELDQQQTVGRERSRWASAFRTWSAWAGTIWTPFGLIAGFVTIVILFDNPLPPVAEWQARHIELAAKAAAYGLLFFCGIGGWAGHRGALWLGTTILAIQGLSLLAHGSVGLLALPFMVSVGLLGGAALYCDARARALAGESELTSASPLGAEALATAAARARSDDPNPYRPPGGACDLPAAPRDPARSFQRACSVVGVYWLLLSLATGYAAWAVARVDVPLPRELDEYRAIVSLVAMGSSSLWLVSAVFTFGQSIWALYVGVGFGYFTIVSNVWGGGANACTVSLLAIGVALGHLALALAPRRRARDRFAAPPT